MNISGQIQQQREVPKRLDEYSQEERDSFPRLFEWSVHNLTDSEEYNIAEVSIYDVGLYNVTYLLGIFFSRRNLFITLHNHMCLLCIVAISHLCN